MDNKYFLVRDKNTKIIYGIKKDKNTSDDLIDELDDQYYMEHEFGFPQGSQGAMMGGMTPPKPNKPEFEIIRATEMEVFEYLLDTQRQLIELVGTHSSMNSFRLK